MPSRNNELFVFSCGKCGKYQTDKTTFLSFLTPSIAVIFNQLLESEDAAGFQINFRDNVCPRCHPTCLRQLAVFYLLSRRQRQPALS